MSGIRTSIVLEDHFSNTFNAFANLVNTGIYIVEDFQSAIGQQIDTTSIQSVEDQLNATTVAAQELDAAMQNVSSPFVQSPELNLPDETTVPITPVITEQPQVDVSEDITVPINPVVNDIQVDVPDAV